MFMATGDEPNFEVICGSLAEHRDVAVKWADILSQPRDGYSLPYSPANAGLIHANINYTTAFMDTFKMNDPE